MEKLTTQSKGIWQNLLRGLIWSAQRVVVLYIILFSLIRLTTDYDSAIGKARLAVLNRLIPFPHILVQKSEAREPFDEKYLVESKQYYEKVAEYIPLHKEEAYAMLGFFYYHLGEPQRAISFLKYSIALNPHFFWTNYNLGVLYYKNGRYQEAAEILKKAADAKPDVSLMIMFNSRIYNQILRTVADLDKVIEAKLKTGYRDAHKLLVLSYYHLKDYTAVLNLANYAIRSSVGAEDFFYYYSGLAAYDVKEYMKSIYFFQECIKKEPNHADALHYLGMCLKIMGNKGQAEAAIKKAAFLHQENISTPFNEEEIDLRIF